MLKTGEVDYKDFTRELHDIAYRLALAGDRGRYSLQILEIDDDEYHSGFLCLIDCLEKMKGKKWEEENSEAIQRDLVEAMALLECLLPTFWNTQTRHMMGCRFIKQLNLHGSFWAIAMLVIECYHILIKKCGRSRKNMLASIVNNYEIFDLKNTDWSVGENEPDPELQELTTRYDMFPEKPINKIISLGKRQALESVQLSESLYLKIMRLYKYPKGTVVSKLVTKYISAIEKSKKFFFFHEWEPVSGHLTKAEATLQAELIKFAQTGKNKTKKINRAYLGEAFFALLITSRANSVIIGVFK